MLSHVDSFCIQGILNHKRYGKLCQGTIMSTSIYIAMLNKISVCSMCHLEFSLTFFFFWSRIYKSIVVHEAFFVSFFLYFFFSIEGSSLWCMNSLERSSCPADFEKLEKCFAQ